MHFLGEILGSEPGEKAYLLVPVGYPALDALVPDLPKKPLEKVLTWRRVSGRSGTPGEKEASNLKRG